MRAGNNCQRIVLHNSKYKSRSEWWSQIGCPEKWVSGVYTMVFLGKKTVVL